MDKIEKYEDTLLEQELRLQMAKVGGWLFGGLALFGCIHFSEHIDSEQLLRFDAQQSFHLCFLLAGLSFFVAQYFRSQLLHLESVKRYRRALLSQAEKPQGRQQTDREGLGVAGAPPSPSS